MQPSRLFITDLILHLHPRSTPASTLRFSLSWGLGGMAATLIGLLVVTGVLMLLVYQPSEHAYDSVVALSTEVPFGRWVRNIHYLSANLLVVIALLHLLRVALTGGFGPGRRLNWIVGLALFVLVLAANFTGYLLPWDQLAFWAVTICTSMLGYIPLCGVWLQELVRGGGEIGPATLSVFFVLHVAVIPGALCVLLLWHFWLVRRAGGLVRAEGDSKARVPAAPDLVLREAAVGLGLIACVLLPAMVWELPLPEQANPGMSPNPTKAPWYFQGFQELLLHLHPTFAIFIWPLLGAAAFAGVPFLRGSSLPPGRWFGSPRGRSPAVWSVLVGMAATAGAILLDNLLQHIAASPEDAWITRGAAPTALLCASAFGAYALMTKRLRRSRAEVVMSGLLFVLAMMTVCTIVGVWFRGPEMRLVRPWDALGRLG